MNIAELKDEMKKKPETYIFRISFYIQFVFFLVSLIVLVPLDILGAEEKKINTIDKSILSENSERKGKEESYTIARVNQKESQNERSQRGYLGPSGSIGGGILIRNEGINKYEEIGIDLENHPGYRIGRYKIRNGAKMRHTDLAIRSSDYMPLAFFEEMIFIAGVVCGDEGADIYANQWSENGLSEEKKWSAISALPDERRGWYVSPNGLKSLSLDKISGDRT